MSKNYSFRKLKEDFAAEVKEELKELPLKEIENDDCYDSLVELVDERTPIMTYDLLMYAIDEPSLAIEEPELLAFDGKPTAVNAIAGRIYEELMDVALKIREEMIKEKAKRRAKIKKNYLACIWCGRDMPDDRPYAKYCCDRCKREALGQKAKS